MLSANQPGSTSGVKPGLTVLKGVTLSELCKPVWVGLNTYFIRFNKTAVVTSGLRDAAGQIAIIQSYAIRFKVHDEFPEVLSATLRDTVMYEGKQVYGWQVAWSRLLSLGVIVNPPLEAEVLMPYKNRFGIEMKGKIIHPSPHIRGTAFDIGGGTNGPTDEELVVAFAFHEGIKGFRGYLVEPRNNAIHIDCEGVL